MLQIDETGGIKSVAVLSKIKAFDSENSNRDAHMMEITEALAFPYVSFKSNEIRVSGKDQLLAKGILSFHGREKMIEVPCNYIKEAKKVVVSGNFEFLLEDFNITPPSLMLMKTESLVRSTFPLPSQNQNKAPFSEAVYQ
jgi:polyisoprenoid-binding protein YceI